MTRFLMCCLTCMLLAATTDKTPQADLIITNARVWTVDPDQPEAEAIAVVRDRIVVVGTSQQVNEWKGSRTQVIDARGRRVIPGFNDAHVHFVSGGLQLTNVDLKDASSPREFALKIEQRA